MKMIDIFYQLKQYKKVSQYREYLEYTLGLGGIIQL